MSIIGRYPAPHARQGASRPLSTTPLRLPRATRRAAQQRDLLEAQYHELLEDLMRLALENSGTPSDVRACAVRCSVAVARGEASVATLLRALAAAVVAHYSELVDGPLRASAVDALWLLGTPRPRGNRRIWRGSLCLM